MHIVHINSDTAQALTVQGAALLPLSTKLAIKARLMTALERSNMCTPGKRCEKALED